MGLFKSDKNLAEQLADRDAQIADLTARIEAAEATVGEKLEAAKAMEAVHSAVVAEFNAKAEANAAAIAAKEAELVAATAEVENLKAKLASPPDAYKHASDGVKTPVAEGGDGEGKSYWAQYYAIESGAERTKFWRAHRKDLENEQQNAVKQ
jgi:hypothetical protein